MHRFNDSTDSARLPHRFASVAIRNECINAVELACAWHKQFKPHFFVAHVESEMRLLRLHKQLMDDPATIERADRTIAHWQQRLDFFNSQLSGSRTESSDLPPFTL